MIDMKPSNNPNLELSVVVLSYGCGEAVRTFTHALQKELESRFIEYEIILAGNYTEGKPDPTSSILRELAKENPRVIALTEPTGSPMGLNMKAGLRVARGKTVAVIDGDGQMPSHDILRVYDKLISENLDLVKTKRIQRYDGPWRRIISKIFNWAMHILFYPVVGSDINSKPKIFTREALESLHLESNEWFIDAEIMIQAYKKKFRMGEIPTEFFALDERHSFISIRAIVQFVKSMLAYRWKKLWKS